jgi:hypothetical protein
MQRDVRQPADMTSVKAPVAQDETALDAEGRFGNPFRDGEDGGDFSDYAAEAGDAAEYEDAEYADGYHDGGYPAENPRQHHARDERRNPLPL